MNTLLYQFFHTFFVLIHILCSHLPGEGATTAHVQLPKVVEEEDFFESRPHSVVLLIFLEMCSVLLRNIYPIDYGCWSVSKANSNLITTSLVKLWPCQLVRRMVPNVKSCANKMVVEKVFFHQRLHSQLEGTCSMFGGQSDIVILLQGCVSKRFAHFTCPSTVCCQEKEAKDKTHFES